MDATKAAKKQRVTNKRQLAMLRAVGSAATMAANSPPCLACLLSIIMSFSCASVSSLVEPNLHYTTSIYRNNIESSSYSRILQIAALPFDLWS